MTTLQLSLPSDEGVPTGLEVALARTLDRPALRWLRHNALVLLAVPLAATVSFLALSQSTPPSIPAIALSADPLYATAAGDKPALALALSVEFPTAGAQYLTTYTNYSSTSPDGYLGYYDAESCYRYVDSPTETPASPLTTADYKRFDRVGPALPLSTPDTNMPTRTSRTCDDAFSGNFLNWASSSAIDMLRLALTGGDRYIDTENLTILQRALLPTDGAGYPSGYGDFWNSSNFPAKTLLRNAGTGNPNYFGAVPNAMATASGGQNIVIGNRLNRIYFGNFVNTSPATYTLGSSTAGSSGSGVGTLTNPYQTPSTGRSAFESGANNFYSCPHTAASGNSSEGIFCSFSGTKEVLYGAPPGSQPNTSAAGGWLTYVASGGITCGNTMTGATVDPAQGVYKRCYYRDYTPPSGEHENNTSAGLNSDGFFYARVKVCNVNSAGELQDSRDYTFCKQYPNGKYKPTGAIQKYSDQLRLSAFGYLIDQTNARFGAVLRAPMKYVGAKTYDVHGAENTPTGGNPKTEWSQSTGVFVTNSESNTDTPSSSGAYLSGVIPYVNMFGRTGPIPGRYKIYDPFSELHYETLRYLQGLAPSTASISGLTSDMKDGYPVYTTWTDPYGGDRSSSNDYTCLKSTIIMIGDKNTNEGYGRLPATDIANNIPNLAAWTTVVQNFEKNISSTYVDGDGVTQTTRNPNGSNTAVTTGVRAEVMGSAYWARSHDIRGADWTNATASGAAGTDLQRPGLRVKTYIFDVNEFSQSTDANTRRTSNQLFMAAKYGGYETDPSNLAKNPYNTHGNPFYRDDMTTADNYVWADTDTRASRVGEANAYFMQSDGRSVLTAFDDIFNRAASAARSIAGGAIQSKNLTQAGNTIYQGIFDTADWSGDLLAIPVTLSSSNVVTISTTTNWTAATQLAALTTPATTRNIVVGNTGATSNPVAVPFKWDTPAGTAGIETSLRTALDKRSPSATADGLAQDRLNFLRGDRSLESTTFRRRNKLLGDIINSGVFYSGAPSGSSGSSTYAAFVAAHASRAHAIFVGANDGMLHAFAATTGNEMFAYIPSWIAPKMVSLTDPNYINAHESFVDGTPVVAEAEVGTAGTVNDWKTVLVGGTGGGGQGVFALDVTDPASFAAANVMWEFTHADDADMGNVTGRPQILKLRTNAFNATTPTYKWFAVVGSGVNNYVSDSAGRYSGTGNPAIFFLDLNKAAGDPWTLGTNYFKVSFPVNSTLSLTKPTGLINFRAAVGLAREVTQIYAGDLHGNLWKLDFSLSAGTSEWNLGKLSSFNKGSSSPDPYPLFIAKDSAGTVQPITMAPSIAFGPERDSTYVFFGTGKYYEDTDKTSTTTQTEYMIYDNGSNSGDTLASASTRASAISGRSRLKQGTANASTGLIVTPAFTPGRAGTDLDTEVTRSGWYADLPTSGERQISNATISGTKVIFGSLTPGTTGSTSCGSSGGGGNQYTVDLSTGNGDSLASAVGILGEPLVSEISPATTYTAADSTGRKLKTVTSQVFQQGSSGVSVGRTSTITLTAGRLSWRQINNYQDLKHAP